MKRLIGLVVLFLLGFYVVWPGYAGYQIKNALEAKDPAALSGNIDFASVKESLRPAATAEAERTIAETLQKSGASAGALGADIAKKVMPKLIDSSLDALVTPENIIRIYSEGGGMKESVARIINEQLSSSGGISGLGAIVSGGGTGKTTAITGALEGIGKALGVNPGGIIPKRAAVRTGDAPAGAAGQGEAKSGFGFSNIKRLGLNGPLSLELGVAKDAAAADADVTAEMSFTGTGWKLTALRPRI